METATITMDESEAQAKLDAMQRVDPRRLTAHDLALMKGYKALAKGNALLNLTKTIRDGGINELGLPRLAVARADAFSVKFDYLHSGGGRFIDNLHTSHRMTTRIVQIPMETWTDQVAINLMRNGWSAQNRHAAFLPTIPVEVRPEIPLNHFHILWEAEWKPVAPVDPILLRHLTGTLYVVIAQWDLTELEQAVLSGRINEQR